MQSRGHFGVVVSSNSGSGGVSSSTTVKLPLVSPGGALSKDGSSDALLEQLRGALLREIDYRRQLEAEVVQLKDNMVRVLQFQQRTEQQLQLQSSADREGPDSSSTAMGGPQRPSSRPHSGSRRRHAYGGSTGGGGGSSSAAGGSMGSPRSSPPPPPPNASLSQQALLHLAPVLPLSTKVAELEEKINEQLNQASQRQAALQDSVTALSSSCSNMEGRLASLDQAALEARSSAAAEQRRSELGQTELLEQQSSALRQLTATVTMLQQAVDGRLAETASVAATVKEQGNLLGAVANLTNSSFPKQLDKLSAGIEGALTATKEQAAHMDRLETDLRAQFAMQSERQTAALQAAAVATEASLVSLERRLMRALEECVSALPLPHPDTVPRVNHLFVQLDRLETTVEQMAKQVAKRGNNGSSTGGGSSKSSSSAAAAQSNEQQEENMRAIRAAIGQVDAKITESNALNAALHERMNGLDTTVGVAKKQAQDLLPRVKQASQQAKEAEAAAQAFEARITKVETDVRHSRERERKRATEREEAASASAASSLASTATAAALSTVAVPAASSAAAPASSGGTETGAPSSSSSFAELPESLRAALEERLKKERARVKQSTKLAVDQAGQEIAAAATASVTAALGPRIDALEKELAAAKKKAVIEEKRRASAVNEEPDGSSSARKKEEREQQASAERVKRASDSSALLQALHALQQQSGQSESTLQRLEAAVAEGARDAASLRSQTDKRMLELEKSLAALSATSPAAASASSATAALETTSKQLRSDVDALAARGTQQAALLAECNKELSVSSLAAVITVQEFCYRPCFGAHMLAAGVVVLLECVCMCLCVCVRRYPALGTARGIVAIKAD
jgi:hypothetical protein